MPRMRQQAQAVLGRSRDPLRDLTLREFVLPWVNFTIIADLLPGKAPDRGRGGAAAC
jgi:hypothetical protein